VAEGFHIVDSEHDLPDLADTEIALYRAPGALSKAAELLADHIVRSLESERAPRPA